MSDKVKSACQKIVTWQSMYLLLVMKTEETGKEWFSIQQLGVEWPSSTTRYYMTKLRKFGMIETKGRTSQSLKMKAIDLKTEIRHR